VLTGSYWPEAAACKRPLLADLCQLLPCSEGLETTLAIIQIMDY